MGKRARWDVEMSIASVKGMMALYATSVEMSLKEFPNV
jgi:hypothetical protein